MEDHFSYVWSSDNGRRVIFQLIALCIPFAKILTNEIFYGEPSFVEDGNLISIPFGGILGVRLNKGPVRDRKKTSRLRTLGSRGTRRRNLKATSPFWQFIVIRTSTLINLMFTQRHLHDGSICGIQKVNYRRDLPLLFPVASGISLAYFSRTRLQAEKALPCVRSCLHYLPVTS